MHGAPLIRNLTNRNVLPIIISGSGVRDVHQLDHPSFIDFALFLGTDFFQCIIKNLGPAHALNFIREYRTIERVVDFETKCLGLTHQAYLAEVQLA